MSLRGRSCSLPEATPRFMRRLLRRGMHPPPHDIYKEIMNFNILLLPGDGIGPEVVSEAVRVLEVITSKHHHTFNFRERLMGGCSIDKYGQSITEETLADCKASDAVLLGAVGGPKWDDPNAK